MQNEVREAVEEDHLCPICLDAFYKPVTLRTCQHNFCDNCLNEAAVISNNRKCPLCRQPFALADIRPHQDLSNLMQKLYPLTLNKKKTLISERVMVRFLIGNETEFLPSNDDNKYRWEFYVRPVPGEEPLSKVADLVEVSLHPTFQPAKLKFHPKGLQPIKVERLGWGTFRIGVKVHWKKNFNEGSTEFHHDLEFVPQAETVASTFLTLRK